MVSCLLSKSCGFPHCFVLLILDMVNCFKHNSHCINCGTSWLELIVWIVLPYVWSRLYGLYYHMFGADYMDCDMFEWKMTQSAYYVVVITVKVYIYNLRGCINSAASDSWSMVTIIRDWINVFVHIHSKLDWDTSCVCVCLYINDTVYSRLSRRVKEEIIHASVEIRERQYIRL